MMKSNMKYVLRELFEEALEDLVFGKLPATDERVTRIDLIRKGDNSFRLNKDQFIKIDCALDLLKEDIG